MQMFLPNTRKYYENLSFLRNDGLSTKLFTQLDRLKQVSFRLFVRNNDGRFDKELYWSTVELRYVGTWNMRIYH